MSQGYDENLTAPCAPLIAGTCLLLLGCSSAPPPKPEAKAPPEPVTGLHALAQMFSDARQWQADALVFRVTSIHAGDLKPQPGRAAVWQGTFVSPTLQQSRTYTYSVTDISTTLRQGIFADSAASFSARGQSAQPFPISAAKKDTDEIYQTALAHAEAYAKAHPDETVTYLLELNNRAAGAAWRVIWGESATTSAFSVLVDASTGTFISVIH